MVLPKRAQLAPKAILAHAKWSAQGDDYVTSQTEADGLGLALAIVASGAVVHAAGYGLADVREGIPAAQDTMFHLASCGNQLTA
jgi:CubicO group peptidase (beta-lactamase class C family)